MIGNHCFFNLSFMILLLLTLFDIHIILHALEVKS